MFAAPSARYDSRIPEDGSRVYRSEVSIGYRANGGVAVVREEAVNIPNFLGLE